MSSDQDVRPVSGDEGQQAGFRNQAAALSLICGFASVAAVGSWPLFPPLFVYASLACALGAVIAGHVGRWKARRRGGEGRWAALAGLLAGWLMLTACLLLALLSVGLFAAFFTLAS
ncbi:hypothetical protein [Streptomyces sp. XH2]|uniref:hypothetical protein n=1 Tax=Streptomyces sp. XH2 TaxID=3412483 RepID=UPI003C7E27BE